MWTEQPLWFWFGGFCFWLLWGCAALQWVHCFLDWRTLLEEHKNRNKQHDPGCNQDHPLDLNVSVGLPSGLIGKQSEHPCEAGSIVTVSLFVPIKAFIPTSHRMADKEKCK
jgi:hypothetical protein